MLRRAVKVGLLGLAASALLVFAPAVLADGSANGITNSPHDFSSSSWNFRSELCRVCHVPHDHGRDTGLIGLLWNHALSEATYEMYSSDTLEGAQDAAPTGISKMCLGCHDGTVALDAFDKQVAFTTGTFLGDLEEDYVVPQLTVNGDLDLSATHPISIVYDENAPASDLNPKTATMGTSGTIDDVLENGKVQCHSCHDVHDSAGEAKAGTHLLREAQTTAQGGNPSGLCLTCHNK